MEDFSMSDRILRSLTNIIENDTELLDFTIVRTEDNSRNKSPVLYQDHHLALESWCVKYIYRHVCSDLFKVRGLLKNRKLSYSKMEEMNYLLIGALLINPDVPTFWNLKKELVECEILNANKELTFSKIILTYKSKSNEAFSYRRWLISRVLNKMSKNNVRPPLNLFENELSVVNMASEKSPNNYHSWSHRMWCVETMLKVYSDLETEIIGNELEYGHKWISSHISEHAGFHFVEYLINSVAKSKNITNVFTLYYDFVLKYFNMGNDSDPGQFLLFLLGKNNKKSLEESFNYVNYISLLLYELVNVIEQLNSIFPDHEALWYHRRFIIYNLLKISHDYHGLEFKNKEKLNFEPCGGNIVNSRYSCVNIGSENGEKEPKIFKGQPNKIQTSNLYEIILSCEKKTVNSSETELAKKHEKWLKYIVGLEL